MRASLIQCGLLLALGATAPVAVAAPSKTFEDAELGYTIALPAPCRHVQGPGTLEAICTADLDPVKSADIQAAGALLFELDAEIAPPDAKPYTEADFRSELPDSVCGTSDAASVKLERVAEARDGDRQQFSARVTCPEVKFLALPVRLAEARTIIVGRYRYRLLARHPQDDAAAAAPLAKAFFESFVAKPPR